MKTQTQTTITLTEIISITSAHALTEARAILSASNGARLTCAGRVEKVVKRDGELKLIIQANADSLPRPVTVFAEFNEETEKQAVLDLKIRRGSEITVTGKFRTAGYQALTMDECRLDD